LYLSEFLVKLLMFFIPCFLSHVLGVFVIGMTTGYWFADVLALYLSGIGYSVLYFSFFISIMVFCASFTGNAFSRLMSAALVICMPAALIACATAIFSLEANYTQYDSYLMFALRIWSPARILMFFLEAEELNTTALREILGTVLMTLSFLAAGYVIYRRRKSELSGQPVLSKIASALIKYTCMFCAATLMGLIFYLFVDSYIWFCTGSVIGALLIMMFINVILTKSAKQMFQGAAGMGIFSVLFVVFFICFGVDAVGYDRYIPAAASVRSLTVMVDGDVEISDMSEEDEEFYLNFMREYMRVSHNNAPEAAVRYYGDAEEEFTALYLKDMPESKQKDYSM
jgi:hypothetical protein